MPSLLAPSIFLGLLAISTSAQESPVKLCNTDACDYCPNSLTTTGTGYPSCVIYDRDTVLGGKEADYPPLEGDSRMIYYDIAASPPGDCQTIIRTPASTTDVNCGVAIYGGPGGVCFAGDTRATFMVQFCCGTGDCGAAGVKRDGSWGSTMTSAVLRDEAGDVIIPHSVGDASGDKFTVFLDDHGVNASSAIKSRSVSGIPIYKIGYNAPVEKRDCDNFVEDGAPYTKTGSVSQQVSGYICDSNSEVTITNENSVSRTTTFGASVGDPFGIVSASIEFSTEESASQSYSYTFTPKDGQCGHVSFTPFYNCVGGTISGCDDGDQTGEVCTAKRISETQIDGAYIFVQD